MPQATQLDGRELEQLYLPFDLITSELSPEPRLVAGENSYVTLGGALRKRPGISNISTLAIPTGYDDGLITGGSTVLSCHLWEYWTLENTDVVPFGGPAQYVLASFRNTSTSLWEMFWTRPGVSSNWTSLGSLRNINASIRPHELIVVRGKAYIKGFPNGSDKYATVIFDGTSPSSVTVRPWGIPGPLVPARISGKITRLNGTITSGAASLVVTANYASMPTTPFLIQVDYETMQVTGVVGTTWTVTRGFNGTTASAHDTLSSILYKDWSISDHRVDVYDGWGYTYAYKSITGQISNVAGLETNPDNLPSFSGPFADLKPKITLEGHSDTTNIPKIVVYRTTDGGGTFYKLEEIDNPGSGAFTYIDDSLASGGGSTFNDPIPDNLLDTGDIAPGTATNTPPVPVLSPKVIGTDEPEHHTPFAYYAGRIWFGIKNTLIYSSNEELDSGIPEESFNTRSVGGNFIVFPHRICNVLATTNALYVLTIKSIFIVTGVTKETFSPRVLYQNVGSSSYPRGAVAIKNKVAFITTSGLIAVTNDSEEPDYLSTPLGNTLIGGGVAYKDLAQLLYYSYGDKDWLIVNAPSEDGYIRRQLILDFGLTELLKKPFWFTPWSIPASSFLVTEFGGTALFCASSGGIAVLSYPKSLSEDFLDKTRLGNLPIDFSFTTNLFRAPAGNQLNEVSIAPRNPVQQYLKISYTAPQSKSIETPQISFYFDDFWTTPIPGEEVEIPHRRKQSLGFITSQYQINRTADRIAFKYAVPKSSTLIEIQDWGFILHPSGGA